MRNKEKRLNDKFKKILIDGFAEAVNNNDVIDYSVSTVREHETGGKIIVVELIIKGEHDDN